MYRSEPLHCESLIHTGIFSLKAILCLKHWLKNDLLLRCQLQKTPCTWLHLGRVSPAAEPPPSSDPPIFSLKSLIFLRKTIGSIYMLWEILEEKYHSPVAMSLSFRWPPPLRCGAAAYLLPIDAIVKVSFLFIQKSMQIGASLLPNFFLQIVIH